MNASGWNLFAAPCLALAAVTFHPHAALHQVAANAQAANRQADPDDARAWRERLQNSDLSVREIEFEALVEHARASEATRARVEDWSNDHDHLEFAWTCRLALREVKTRGSWSSSWNPSGDPFESLRQHMFSGGFGTDPFGGFLMIDPFAQGQAGMHGGFAPFHDFQQGSELKAESQGFSLEIGPDGVKARVKKNVNGEEVDEEYSANSLEELLLAHPELSLKIHGRNSSFGLRFGLPGFEFEHWPGSGFPGPRTDVLGVWIVDETSKDGVDSTGLRIERVQPGSLAEKLGLEPGQVLITLNGRQLKTRDDISAVLRERRADQGIEVELRGSDGVLSTKTWKPPEDAVQRRGEAHPLLPRPAQGTRKI